MGATPWRSSDSAAGEGAGVCGSISGRSKAKPFSSSTSSRLWPGWMLSSRNRAFGLSKAKTQNGVTGAPGPPRRKTWGGLVPGHSDEVDPLDEATPRMLEAEEEDARHHEI